MKQLQELIEAGRAGDRLAQERLVEKAQNHVYGHCLKLLGNAEDALDTTQDTLIVMLRALGELRTPEAFWSWLDQITVNLCCKRLRRSRKLSQLEREAVLEVYENFDDQTMPEKILDNEENRRLIVELVDALPEAQRLCILCYYYNEMSVRDIAAAMETSENTVKSRLHYARRTIKEGVERYTAQGIKLYAFSPLPFLRYFLQQEAAESLPPAAAAAIEKAILAAGLGAAGAAGAAGTVGGTAVVTAVKAEAVRRGLLALAGLALAGVVGGSVLPHNPQSPAETEPAAAQELVMSSAPEKAEPLTLPEPAAPVVEEAPPAAETGGGAPRMPAVLRSPVLDMSAQEENRESSEPRTSDRERGGESDWNFISSPVTEDFPNPENEANVVPAPEPAPVPAPSPEPGTVSPEPSVPEVPVIQPAAQSSLYRPNLNFGAYLGENADGVHEFEVELVANRQRWTSPFLPGRYYERLEITDSVRVDQIAGNIYGKAPGSCVVRYYVSSSPDGPFELKAIAHVTIIPAAPITPNYDWGTYQWVDGNGVFYFKQTVQSGDTVRDMPLVRGQFFSKAESSDSSVVMAGSDGQLYAAGPGSAEIRYYTRWAEVDAWTLAAVVQMTVQEAPVPEPPPPVAEKQLTTGYGFVSSFAGEWGGPLPETLVYASSKPAVVRIIDTGGFTAFAPGTAVLTAWDPEVPDVRYALNVEVVDAFQWEHSLKDITLSVGETLEQKLTPYSLENAVLTGTAWTSTDPLIAALKEPDLEKCEVVGIAPGVTEVQAYVNFLVLTPEGQKTMHDTVTFQVHVEEARTPEDDVTVLKQELTSFGYSSGYGFNSSFANTWKQSELPENLTYLSSDPAVVYVDTYGRFSTLSAGTAVLTAWDPDDPSVRYELTVQVQDRFDWNCQMSGKRILIENSGEPVSFTCSRDGNVILQSTRFTSSDPSVAEVVFSSLYNCNVKGRKPGTAEITCTFTFLVDTHAGKMTMQDTCSCTVTVDYSVETETRELESFGFCSGYGYTGKFSDFWPGLPDEDLSYRSTDYGVISIGGDGTFTTKTPGKATLIASTSGEPEHQYALTIQVRDSFDWRYTLEDLTLEQGETIPHSITNYEVHPGTRAVFSIWESGDSYVASAVKGADPLTCNVTASGQGSTEVKGNIDFFISSGSVRVKVTFRVTVVPPETEEETPDPLE